jgi:hypothetical protein
MPTEEQRQRGLAILEEAIPLARRARPAIARFESVGLVAGALAEIEPDRAFALMEEARQTFRRALGLDETEPPVDPRAQAKHLFRLLSGERHSFNPEYVQEVLDRPDPQVALAEARESAERMVGEEAFTGVAEAAARAFPERAQEFFAHTPHADYDMANAVRAFARTDPSRALALARTIERRWNRVQGLLEVAGALAAAEPARARDLAHEALSEAREEEREDYRQRLLASAVFTLRQVDRETARGVARELTDPYQRARALLAVAWAFLREAPAEAAVLLEETEAAARQDTEPWVVWASADAVEAWSEIDPARGRQLAESVSLPEAKVKALAKLFPRLADQDPQAAWQMGEEIAALSRQFPPDDDICGREEPSWWEIVFPVLARLDPERALRLAEACAEAAYEGWIIYRTARAVAESYPDRAPALFARLTQAEDRGRAQEVLSEVMAGTNPEQAVTLAQAISDENGRNRALISIVQTLTRLDPYRALSLLRRLSNWVVAHNTLEGLARALVETDPPVAAQCALEILHQQEEEHAEGGFAPGAYRFFRDPILLLIAKADLDAGLAIIRRERPLAKRVELMVHVALDLLGVGYWSEDDFTEQEPLL